MEIKWLILIIAYKTWKTCRVLQKTVTRFSFGPSVKRTEDFIDARNPERIKKDGGYIGSIKESLFGHIYDYTNKNAQLKIVRHLMHIF